MKKAIKHYLLRLADSSLTQSQRLAEWCGHGPFLEEDIALTNVALDLLGHAKLFYEQAAEISEQDVSADDLAFLRDVDQFRNPILTELPRGDFAYTTLKQYFFDQFNVLLYAELMNSQYQPLAEIAEKALKESRYHLTRSRDWCLRLSLSTAEAKQKIQSALDDLYFYTPELFETDDQLKQLLADNVMPDMQALKQQWQQQVDQLLQQCQLQAPTSGWLATGGLRGEHSEYLGYMLADMQFLQRAYPGCEW
ncbi:MAG: phenylacetate-CoA oxygenase subunit PaaI [Proteobacteria bacterium]|nr:MAG: phenylacetate-CoA oxygenase subunit PaaI [Pseudomonadota bacterium]